MTLRFFVPISMHISLRNVIILYLFVAVEEKIRIRIVPWWMYLIW